MRIIFGGPAADDLAEIGDWIARDNPARALSYVRELRQSCASLAEYPNAYPIMLDLPGGDIRRRNHGAYAILYRAVKQQVQIVAILHSARDIASEMGRRVN